MEKIFKWWKIGLLMVVVGIGFGWYRQSANSEDDVSYQTSRSEYGDLIVSVTASGQVASTNSRTVTTTASGVVKKVLVSEGQSVKTGTPLMEIDLDLNGRQKLQAAYSAYQSAANNLKSSQDKIYELESQLVAAKNIFINQWSMQSPDDPTYIQKHNSYLSAQESYTNLANTLKQQKAALESARLSYQMAGATVYAPISGIVSAISLTQGMILNPTSDSANSSNSENKIAIVKTGATPAITVGLTEIDVVKVEVGNRVTITLDAFPDKTFTGKVMAVDTAGTVNSGVASYPTTIQLDLADNKIMPNMSATANIITKVKNNVIKIPSSAIQFQDGQTTVRVMKNGKIENRSIVGGVSSDTETEVIEGLEEGEEIVTAVINASASKINQNSTSVFGSFGPQGGQMRMR